MGSINGVDFTDVSTLTGVDVKGQRRTVNGNEFVFGYCECIYYELENTDVDPPPPDPPLPPTDVNYDDCDGNTGQTVSLFPGEITQLCACEGTISAPGNINVTDNGPCCYDGSWNQCT